MYRRFIYIGVIITVYLMTFEIYLPIYLLLVLLSIFQTIYLSSCCSVSLHIIYILLVVIVGQVALFNSHLDDNFIPVEKELVKKIEITILKDSKLVKGRFYSIGKISKVYSDNFLSFSNYTTPVRSYRELFKGEHFCLKHDSSSIINISDQNSSSSHVINIYRRKVIKKIIRNTCSGMLLALLIGNKNKMNESINELFKTTGTSHILALSGFHLSLIAILIFTLLRAFSGQKIKYFLTVILLFLYINITGITPSLFRAFIMFIIFSIYKVNYSNISPIEVISFSFIISIIIFPNDFYTISFKLSYSALLGIIVLGSKVRNISVFRITPAIISVSLSASIGATMGTSFIVLDSFGAVYPIGILASLILTPLISIYMVFGISSLFVKFLRTYIVLFEEIIVEIASVMSKSPSIYINSGNSSLITLIFISLPVILYLHSIVRSNNVRRFNTEFKL